MHERFRRFARRTSEIVGSAEVFLAACAAIVVWGMLGPTYNFSDTWQLVINTGTTIITFLMVFIIQNSQNRDAAGNSAEARRAHSRGQGSPDRDGTP
jgi:low affinity Fe/Cu permease